MGDQEPSSSSNQSITSEADSRPPAEQNIAPFNTGDFFLRQYDALRNEIVKHIEVEFQVLVLTLAIAGTIVTATVQFKLSPFVSLVYPIIGLFLAVQWMSRVTIEGLLGDYIKETYENRVNKPGVIIAWESLSGGKLRRDHRYFPTTFYVSQGLFFLTQVSAILVAIGRVDKIGSILLDVLQLRLATLVSLPWAPVFLACCVLDIIIVVITQLLLRNPKTHEAKKSTHRS
ncbi:MAG: hypothetical protein ACLQUY_15060 [Ktedonobacterales bacterium]